jgi:hypothetical protein
MMHHIGRHISIGAKKISTHPREAEKNEIEQSGVAKR